MSKVLLGYTPIGPTYKNRIVNNLLNFDGYKFFDVILLTNDPNYSEFDKIRHFPNVIIKDVNKDREEYSQFSNYEKLAEEKNDTKIYAEQAVDLWINQKLPFPLHLQRFILNYQDISKYKFIIMSDIDIIPQHTEEDFNTMMYHLENNMPENSVSSIRGYQEWQNRLGVNDFIKEWAEKLGKNIDHSTPVCGFDNPIKLLKFSSPEKIKEFFDLWNTLLWDSFTNPKYQSADTTVISNCWGQGSETLIAILYKLFPITLNLEASDYLSMYHFKSFTFPEDRYWSFGVNHLGIVMSYHFDVIPSQEEYIQNNYDNLKKFYEVFHQIKEFKYVKK